jgi:8-oxo-dGTP pyrophosphatase MutT (NUDIX family)
VAPPLRLLAPGDPLLGASTDLGLARRSVAAVTADDPAVARARVVILRWIDEHPDALQRSCTAGHLTGSALVVDAEGRRITLLRHRKLARWLQPGGHADGEANLAATALREATEETGIEGLRVVVPAVDLDVHRVEPPGESPHLHLDVRYLVIAPPAARLRGNHESTGLVWVAPGDLDAYGVDDGLRRLVAAGLGQAGPFVARVPPADERPADDLTTDD